MALDYWTIKPDWLGDDVFIVAGGTSVTQKAVDSLKGQHVIVVNSSYTRAPWADVLFFADERWWAREVEEHKKDIDAFQGVVATTSRQATGDRLVRLRKGRMPKGLTDSPDTVLVQRTSVHAAICIAVHKGAKRIILLGVDNRDGENGRVHHHPEYPWKRLSVTWDVKLAELALTVEPLKALGIKVINCSHISELPWWPKMTLGQAMRGAKK